MPRTLMDRRQNCAVNGESDLNTEMENIARETDVSLDEMMSLACRQGKLDIVELLLESGAHVDYRNKAGNTPLLEACSQGHKDVAEYLLDHSANIDAATDTTSDSALTWACTLGNEPIVELLLCRKSNVEHRTKDGCTALMFAALAGHVKVATMLLDCKANINVASDSNKDSPLTFACWKGHVDVVKLLLERNGNIEHRTKEGFTPLMFAALGGHTDVAKELLKRQAKVNEPSGSNNDIPLTSACWKGHHEVVKLLLEYKSNIEHRTKDGCTPLMLAAREGHLIVAQLILENGALVNVPSGSENNIPLTLACWKGHTDVVGLLLNHNSDKEHKNKAGCTPLMLASREGHLATTKLLLNVGAEVNTPSGSNEDTPLTLACWKGHHEVVELLLNHDSHVDHQTKTGCTPLMEATREGHEKVVALLLENGADVELPDNYGQSPLFMACWKGHRDVAELLLRYTANRECRTKTGITPLFQACRENHVAVVELLLDQGASVTASFPNSRENPMTLAAEKGYVELMDVLLSRGGNVDCRTKKGCSPFFLACKEGHLEIAISLYENSADIEVCDQRNISPLVAAFKNGHQKVVEWILSIAKHVPSDEQCQKCITAPCEEKDNERDLLYLRTMCYEMIKKAKKVKEQAALENAQSFLQELEEDKVREENKKKKQAAKRRDKRKKKKKQKEGEQQNNMENCEPQPSENRTNTEDDGIYSEDETPPRNVSSDRVQPVAQPRKGDWKYESEIKSRSNVNICRTMTVGQAQDTKENTNSTEERRDDQPQALFDANDHHDHTSPKKAERREKNNQELENNKKNKSHSKRTAASRSQEPNSESRNDAVVNCVISDEHCVVENGVNYEQLEPPNKDKVKPREEFPPSSDFVSRGNIVKSSGHNDTIVKDGWKPTAQRAKQVSSDYLHSWKEVTRNSSSKTMVIQLTAPNALCGRVIGRGGSKINGITEESGAQITIGKPDPKNPNDRVITIKGTVKCVQKAKQLVSNALNSPSSLAQTPDLTSFSSSSHIQPPPSVAPIRGNFVAIPRSPTEWPTVVQAHSGPTKVQQPLKTADGKAVSVSDQNSENMSRETRETRETRANSAPDLQCSTEARTDQARPGVWFVDTKTNSSPVAPGTTSIAVAPVVPAALYNPTTVSSATKARTKSYATTQDGSRLSYCEVATGIDSVTSKNEDDAQISTSSASNWNQVSGGNEEADNVFVDERNIEETEINTEDIHEHVPAKDPLLVSNPWKEDVKGLEVDSGIQCSPPSSANQSPQTRSMNMLPQSSSLFSGSSWSPRESKEIDKTRSISWSGQDFSESDDGTRNEFQTSQPDMNTLASHSIWSPVQPGGMAADNDTVEAAAWENSNSASSSRSSSRLELSSIMENEKSASLFPQNTSPGVANTCDVKELSDEYPGSWISSRGAHSAPSSPSLRSRDHRMKQTRPVTAQSNSYDDMSDRLWSSRRQANDDPPVFDSLWNANITQAQSSSSLYNQQVNSHSTSSPKLGSFKHYHDTSGVNKWSDPMLETFSHDVMRLLEQLSLTKYKQTFEENYVTMNKLMNMTETDLQKLGVPKGPRLKIMHAVQNSNGITNGPVSHKNMNERVPGSAPPSDMLGHGPGAGTLLNHMQMEQNVRVSTHTPFTQVLPPNTQMLQKQHADASLNHVLLPYLNNTHHSLLSLDPSLAGPPPHSHLEQHMNGLHPQQQFMMPTVPSDQYDPQSPYMTSGVPYQQQMFYRPTGGYYYYP